MYKSKLLLFILCFLLLFNIIFEPIRVQAHPAVISGGKLVAFLLALASAGVTLDVVGKSDSQLVSEANSLLQNFENAKGALDGWKNIILAYVTNKGYEGLNAFDDLLDDIKDWAVDMSFVSGLNNVYSDYYYGSSSVSGSIAFNETKYFKTDYAIVQLNFTEPPSGYYYNAIFNWTITTNLGTFNGSNGVWKASSKIITVRTEGSSVRIFYDGYGTSHVPFTGMLTDDVDLIPSTKVNVSADAYPLTGTPPFYYDKPNMMPPPFPAQSWDPELGRQSTTWPGTPQEFADGFTESMTWDDYKKLVGGNTSLPYTVTESLTVPGTSVIEWENESSIPVPFPDVNIGEIADTPAFQGATVGLLQTIVNWLSGLIEAVLSLPALIGQSLLDLLTNLIEALRTLMQELFIPDANFMQNKMNDINGIISSKIGDQDYSNFLDNVKSLTGEPIPDMFIDGYKVLDASYINNLAVTLKTWQRWFWYILIALYGMNNTYRLIRGSSMVDFNSYEGGKK